MKIFKKKQKPEGDGLKPRGIKLTLIPKEYLEKFKYNDLNKFTNKKELI
jgi:hypothetical protein